jgi:CopG family nickel-responsive transcriptional regulator
MLEQWYDEVNRSSYYCNFATNHWKPLMQRITITLDDDLIEDIDRLMAVRGYQNRSEAIRDLARAGVADAHEGAGGKGECVAAVVYVYDHAARDLAGRLTDDYHHHHDLSLATLHVHLDEDTCMEVTAMRGPNADVRHFANHVIAERGVRYGKVVVIPTEAKPKGKGKHRHRP